MQTAIIAIEGEEIPVTHSPDHEYVVETELVAKGYGVTKENIRQHKLAHADELVEGKHWVVRNTNTPGGKQRKILWTKRGIVRLGFFIRSARAKLFRDLAEDLVIAACVPAKPQTSGAVDVYDLCSELLRCNRRLLARLEAVEVEHQFAMRELVRQGFLECGRVRNDGLPDRRAASSPVNGRLGGRPRKTRGARLV